MHIYVLFKCLSVMHVLVCYLTALKLIFSHEVCTEFVLKFEAKESLSSALAGQD